jgi:DNA-binding transcriptional regulator PaaX
MRDALARARAALAGAGRLSPAEAFAERYRSGGLIVDALFRDPLLPPAFLPADWPAGELRRLFAELDATLERRSRPFWESILGKEGAGKRRRK